MKDLFHLIGILNKNYGNPRMMETTIRRKKILQTLKQIINNYF